MLLVTVQMVSVIDVTTTSRLELDVGATVNVPLPKTFVTGLPKVIVWEAFEALPVTVFEAPVYEAVVFVIVAVEVAPAESPLTVTRPSLLIETVPGDAVPDHVYPEL